MKAVNVDEVLKILHKYGKYIFVTDEKRYSSMVDEIANLPKMADDANVVLDKIRAEIEQGYCPVNNDYDCGRNCGLYMATQIIDKYKGNMIQ